MSTQNKQKQEKWCRPARDTTDGEYAENTTTRRGNGQTQHWEIRRDRNKKYDDSMRPANHVLGIVGHRAECQTCNTKKDLAPVSVSKRNLEEKVEELPDAADLFMAKEN